MIYYEHKVGDILNNFCEYCGNKIDNDNNSCSECGNFINAQIDDEGNNGMQSATKVKKKITAGKVNLIVALVIFLHF